MRVFKHAKDISKENVFKCKYFQVEKFSVNTNKNIDLVVKCISRKILVCISGEGIIDLKSIEEKISLKKEIVFSFQKVIKNKYNGDKFVNVKYYILKYKVDLKE